MGSIPQSPTKARPRSRDTGFPESFCGSGNTTLPHPDADTSPNACITADDISVNKLLVRSRRSWLVKNNRRTLSSGKITPSMERLNEVIHMDPQEAMASIEREQGMGRPSKDSADSIDRTDTSADGEEESPVVPRVGENGVVPNPSLQGDKADEKRRGVLKKLRLP